MNQKKKIKLIAIVVILSLILIMIICAYTDKIQKNKLTKNNVNALNNVQITTVDITGITPSPESQHEHIYKTHYDDTKHWEECTVCFIKRNERMHSLTTTWALGYESCYASNSYTKTCTCGYSYTGHKPCVWDGRTYGQATASHTHMRMCSVCNYNISTSYYLYSYGNGKLYKVEKDPGEERYPGNPEVGNCRKADGTEITCYNLGICSTCKYDYSNENWRKYHWLQEREGNIICVLCKKEFGTIDVKEEIQQNENTVQKYTIRMNLKNRTSFSEYGEKTYMSNYFSKRSMNILSINSEKTEVTLEANLEVKNSIKSVIKNIWQFKFTVIIDGAACEFNTSMRNVKPDLEKPVISSIQTSGSEWAKSKT